MKTLKTQVVAVLVAVVTAATTIAAIAACGAKMTTMMHEVLPLPTPPRPARTPASVEIYVNSRPQRYTEVTHVIELTATSFEDAHFATYRSAAARVGCDAVVVYTKLHPRISEGPKHLEDVLVLDLTTDGLITSRAKYAAKGSNFKTVFIETRVNKTLVVEGPSFALCHVYSTPPPPPPDEGDGGPIVTTGVTPPPDKPAPAANSDADAATP